MFDFTALNPEQRAVADFEGGPLRVVAGPGTGKTTALTGRVAALVQRGARPDRILLLTFTRRAARQMVSRAQSQIDGRSGRATVVGGTFHSVAHRTLRRQAARIGLPEGFSVLDTADAGDVFDLVREQHGGAKTSGRRFPRKSTLLDVYSRAVNTQQPISEAVAYIAPWATEMNDDIVTICRAYADRKRALGLLDFDDLLLWWRAALADERLGPSLAGAFDHVLVDEYQDVNTLQVDILRELRRGDDRITVVGDDAQAVYGFRAAEPKHLLEFDAVFPGTETIVLHRNYRSTQPICDVANALAEDAPVGFRARLQAMSPGTKRPDLIRCADEDAEIDAVCRRVLEHREQGVPLKEQAVLVRAAHHSALLEFELSARKIPFVKYGGLRFLEAAHVKDLVCLFRLAENPRDEPAWFRVLQLLEGVGPASARRVVDALLESDASLVEEWPALRDRLPATARERADALVTALTPLEGELVVSQAERLRAALAPLVEQNYDDAAARLCDLDALVDVARRAERLADVATELTLEPPQSSGDLAGPPVIDEDWLVISTVHSAKGLEWDVVHVLHATDGNFPSDMALTSNDGLEEERRVFYVGVTRPRHSLHVYVPLRFHVRPHHRDDAHMYGQPSRFLTERVTQHFDRDSAGHDEPAMAAASTATATRVELSLDALWS